MKESGSVFENGAFAPRVSSVAHSITPNQISRGFFFQIVPLKNDENLTHSNNC